MNRLSKTKSAIFSSFLFTWLQKNLTIQNFFILLTTGVVPCGDVKRLLVCDHSADYIFWSFEITGSILSQFKNRVLLKSLPGSLPVLNNL